MSNVNLNNKEWTNKSRTFKYTEKKRNSEPIKSMNPCNVLAALDDKEDDFDVEART